MMQLRFVHQNTDLKIAPPLLGLWTSNFRWMCARFRTKNWKKIFFNKCCFSANFGRNLGNFAFSKSPKPPFFSQFRPNFGQKYVKKVPFFFWKSFDPVVLPKKFWGCFNHFSLFFGTFGPGNTFSAFFAYFAPKGQNGLFLPNFKSKYLSELIPYGNDQGMESPLKFSNFPKMLPKRAFRTQNAPKTTNDKSQNFPNLKILRFVICGFGCVLGSKSPFWQHFRKVWKF